MAFEPGFQANGNPRGARVTPLDDDATVELFALEQDSPSSNTGAKDVDPFRAGATLRDRYRIENVVGGGGRSVIYRARDLRCDPADSEGAYLAIKALRPELRGSVQAIERLKHESRCLRLLSHPNIVRAFDLDCHEGHWFQVMELLEGESLAALFRRRGGSRLPDDEALRILSASAEALACAHRHGVVHGDVKPDNFFLSASGELRLLDFGGLPTSGARDTILATPAYASPQVLSGLPPEARDDVYSLACVAFELLTGEHPFARIDAETARARGMRPVEVAELDPARAAALLGGLAVRREDRPADIRELIARLTKRDASGDGASVDKPAAAAAVISPFRRYRIPLTVAALTIVAIAIAMAALVPKAVPPPIEAVGMRVDPQDAPMPVQQVFAAPKPPESSAAAADSAASKPSAPEEASPPAVVTGGETQFLSFSTARLTVSRAAILAALPLRRSGSPTGNTYLSWRVIPGTAEPDRDFYGPLAGVVPFADGQKASTIFIPVVIGSTQSVQRDFSVAIDNVGARARIGEVASITVLLR